MKFKYVLTAIIAFLVGILLTVLILRALSSGASGVITGHGAPDLAKAEALIDTVTQGNATILNRFQSIGNIEGFVVTTKPPSNKRGILYVDNQGRYLVNNTLINAQGQDIAQQDYYRYAQPNTVNQVAGMVAATAWIQQGRDQAPHKLYVVIDPNCIFCHQVFMALAPKIASGELAVRWIVVGLIKPTSKAKALAILNAKEPLAALLDNETHFNVQTEEGGIAPLAISGPVSTDKLNTNMAFVQQNQLIETPTFFYTDSDGQFQMHAGVPKDLNAFVAQANNQF